MSYVYFNGLDVDVMHLGKLLDKILIILIFFSFILVNTTIAEDGIESKVNANFDIEFVTGTDLKIIVNLDVDEIIIFDTNYDSNSIQTASNDDLETMGAIKLRLRQLIESQIESSFEFASVDALISKPTYNNTKFHDEYGITLTSAFFDLNEMVNSNDFINGVMDMGAVVNYTFNLQAEPGWNNEYVFSLPSSIDYKRTTGSVNENKIKWDVKNGDGNHPNTLAEVSIKLTDSTTSGFETEDIQLEFVIDDREGKKTILTTNILAKHIDIRDYDILPDFINELKIIPSDGIRLFTDNNLLSFEELYNRTIKIVEEITISKIENSSHNQTLNTTFSWDANTTTNCPIPYEISNMDSNPPITAIIKDVDIYLQICGISSRALFGLVNAGAQANISANDVNFGDNLESIGYEYTGILYLPDNLYLDKKNIYNWNQNTPIAGRFESDVADSYSNEKIDTIVEIDVRTTDFNLLSFFTGEMEMNFDLFLKETQNYGVTFFPDEFSLPEKISIDYLNSDAFRLCIEENIFVEDNIVAFLDNNNQLFENRLMSILKLSKIDGSVDRDAFDESLNWDEDIANMDALTPVKVRSYSHSSYPVSFGLSFLPPKFEVLNQYYNFTGIQNQNVTYKMIFPQGITVLISDSLNMASVKKTDDGREYIEISFDSSESGLTDTVSCRIVPSSFFILGLFMPCILSLILTIILVVVIYLVRKRRKIKKGMIFDGRNEEDDDYINQNYYVPPPPKSRK